REKRNPVDKLPVKPRPKGMMGKSYFFGLISRNIAINVSCNLKSGHSRLMNFPLSPDSDALI
ncbi:MAG: hypothetical protein ABIH42_08420, partial [Planctomycetota bacterium]